MEGAGDGWLVPLTGLRPQLKAVTSKACSSGAALPSGVTSETLSAPACADERACSRAKVRVTRDCQGGGWRHEEWTCTRDSHLGMIRTRTERDLDFDECETAAAGAERIEGSHDWQRVARRGSRDWRRVG